MRIIKLKGGLGNQMFQYAFAKNIELLTNEKVLLDADVYESRISDTARKLGITDFNITLDLADMSDLKKFCILLHKGDLLKTSYKVRILAESILNRKYYLEKTRKYTEPEKILKYYYYDGYWQAWKNVYRVEKFLRKDFVPIGAMSLSAHRICEQIENENAVFVGVRRGDYLTNRKNRKHYGEYSADYYLKGIVYIEKVTENPIFYIFSNDKAFVRDHMRFEGHRVKYIDDGMEDFDELMIMGKCKHAIISNSTFYWWGAWLVENKDKIVIAPKKWFADGKPIEIVPDEWISI